MKDKGYDVLYKLVESGSYSPYDIQNHIFGTHLPAGYNNAIVTHAGYKEVIKAIKK